MSSLNIFKLDMKKEISFKNDLFDLNCIGEDTRTFGDDEVEFELYVFEDNESKQPSWNWVAQEFGEELRTVDSFPRGVLLVKRNGVMYGISFGHAYFLLDKYCDRNFAFDFARRIEFEEVKTTTLQSPHLKRNKIVNTFVDYSELEFDSGESFAKIKVKLDKEKIKDIMGPTIEIGSSIKIDAKKNDLDTVIQIINFIENTLEKEVLNNIPLFLKVTDKNRVEELESDLKIKIMNEEVNINISELDIIGVVEVFNRTDNEFELCFDGKRKKIGNINLHEIKTFCDENNINYHKELLNIKVISFYEGSSVRTDTIHNLIDYTNDEQRCVMIKGKWYYYNDYYIEYLNTSIKEIECIYNNKYDFTNDIYNTFIEDIYNKNQDEYKDIDKEKAIQIIKREYYREKVFNDLRESEGFKKYDREIEKYDKAKVELMDLFNDESMIAVKIGNTASKLSYVVDQSITSLKLYKHDVFKNAPKIKNVVLWIVLERQNKLAMVNNQPNIEELNMLSLKIKIAHWKSEVRLQGYTPKILINYTK